MEKGKHCILAESVKHVGGSIAVWACFTASGPYRGNCQDI